MRLSKNVKFMFVFLLMALGGIHFAVAESNSVVGKLVVERVSPSGALGKPISIEITAARSIAGTKQRIMLTKKTKAVVQLSGGWYQVNCRPLVGKDVQGHSVEVKVSQVTRVRCFFDTTGGNQAPRGQATEAPKAHEVKGLFSGVVTLDAENASSAIGVGGGDGGMKIGRASGFVESRVSRRAAKSRSSSAQVFQPLPSYNREGYAHQTENRFRDVSLSPLSTFSIDVDTASYANARRFIQGSGRLPPPGAIRIEEMINYFEYAYAKPESNQPFSIHTEVSVAPWNKSNRLVHVGLQAPDVPFAEAPPLNLVFLIDVSGSMASPNKLPLLKQGFAMMVNKLRAQDRVAIVVYASSEGVVLPSTSGLEKEVILSALSRLRAGGSTNGAAGIKLAYQEARKAFTESGTNRIILATDGDFNVGASSQAALVKLVEKERESGVFLSVIGFGRGNYQDSRMESLSNHGNGFAAYIDGQQEAQRVFERQITGTLVTVAKDVKVQVEFNPAKVKSYRLIGYANRQLATEDFKDDKKDAGDMGSGHSVTVLYEVVPEALDDVDSSAQSLRYQDRRLLTPRDGELLSVKVRYKSPKGMKSNLLERILVDHDSSIGETSNAFRFSAAVAQFGMLLSSSKHGGTSSFSDAIRLAEGALGADSERERSGFIQLVKLAQSLRDK